MNRLSTTAAIFISLFFIGCASHKISEKTADTAKMELRNNAASLLYDLLSDEKNVSKVLIIKRNSDELGNLIKLISKTTGEGAVKMEALAKKNPALNFHALELPPGEKTTRDAISKTKEHELLHTSGDEFQFNLLLTQAEAMNYGWHLAQVVAENSAQPDEAREFSALSGAMENLYHQVVAMMRGSQLASPNSKN